MSAKSDQIFQVSLTEIAFMIAFILLFLLGFQVFRVVVENRELSEELAKLEGIEQKTGDLEKAASALSEALVAGAEASPAEVISKLMADSGAKAEVQRLKKQLEEQDRQLTALAEIQQALEQVPPQQHGEKIQQQIQQSLLLAAQVRQLAQELANGEAGESADSGEAGKPGEAGAAGEAAEQESRIDTTAAAEQAVAAMKEMAQIRKLLGAAESAPTRRGESTAEQVAELVRKVGEHAQRTSRGKSLDGVRKENADLRGQISFLKNRLNARGGMDYPPCWAEDLTGRIQMLFYVELREHDLSVSPAWPPERAADAMSLPNIRAVLARPVTTYPQFIEDSRAISELSRDLNCRYYVKLKSTIADAVQSDRRRLSIEDSFYKYEVRR